MPPYTKIEEVLDPTGQKVKVGYLSDGNWERVDDTEMGIQTLDGAIDVKNKIDTKLAGLEGVDTRLQMTPEEMKAGQAGQEMYKERVKQYYTKEEKPKEEPPKIETTGDEEQDKMNKQIYDNIEQAKKDKDALIAGLSKFSITDEQLNSQISNINNLFDQRVKDMEDINRRRTEAIKTTGIRTGLRYTGGAGGMFGGIITEEERQGGL